jgi:hypothetical protein
MHTNATHKLEEAIAEDQASASDPRLPNRRIVSAATPELTLSRAAHGAKLWHGTSEWPKGYCPNL